MLTPSDLLLLPFTPDLTEGGIAHTIRSLPHLPQTEGPLFDLLRRRVAGAAVELAFRRHLSEQEIPYDVRGALPFTSPDRYDVVLGGRRCDLHSFLIKDRTQIVDMRKSPGVLLRAPALVPSDYHAAEGFSDHDLYLFAFLSGLTASSLEELKKVQEAGQPAYFLHVLPETWARPQAWTPLGPLTLKSESDETMTVELAGQAEGREFLSCTVELPPRTRVLVREPFFALTSVHIPKLFEGRMGIHSPRRKETHIIHWHEWGNLWVYGMEIVLAGYVTRSTFRRRASPMQAGARVFQYRQTPEKHMAMPIADLNPLNELLTQVRVWEAEKVQS
jgi:hypothetical protein